MSPGPSSHSEQLDARPRIALLCQSLSSVGGTQRVIATLSHLLSPHFDTYELSFDPPGTARYFESPAHFVPLGSSWRLPLIFRPVSYAIDAYRLRRAKRRLGVVLTISNLWRADLLSILSAGSDKKVSICHINIVDNKTNRLVLQFRRLASLVYRQFDSVVSVSHPLEQEVRRLFGLSRLKSRVIHNCVPSRTVETKVQLAPRTRIVWCGRFVWEKNVLPLVQAFADAFRTNSSLQLVMIGDGPLRPLVEAEAQRLGLSVGTSFDECDTAVIMMGFVHDPANTIAKCDFQALPSNAEGLGLVLIEGFGMSVPALASDCSGGGVHDAMGGRLPYRPGRLEPEETSCGYLLPVPDPTAPMTMETWRSHILLMAENVRLRSRLAAGAKARAQQFSPEFILPQWLKLIAEIL